MKKDSGKGKKTRKRMMEIDIREVCDVYRRV